MASLTALVAIVGYVLFAAPPDWLRHRTAANRERPELAPLLTALAGRRPVEPRLTGGFGRLNGGFGRPTGGFGRPNGGFAAGARFESEERRSPDAMEKAARLIDQADAQAPPRVLGAAGTAHLVLGDADAAVRLLQQAVDRAPADAMLVNDLAAALLVRATASVNRPALDPAQPPAGRTAPPAVGPASVPAAAARDVERAAALAERASDLDPGLAESWFNRGLAFEALGLTEEAQKAWSQYLRVDPDSAWADEARRRQLDLARVP